MMEKNENESLKLTSTEELVEIYKTRLLTYSEFAKILSSLVSSIQNSRKEIELLEQILIKRGIKLQ